MTSKLTIEQAKRLRNDFECWQQDYDPKDDKEQYDMFGRGMAAMDMLIAGMYQEPVAYIGKQWTLVYYTPPMSMGLKIGDKLYRHAQPAPDDYQHLKNVQELYHGQEKRLFKIAQRIKGPSFDKYSHSPSQAIDVLEAAIFGENEDAYCGAMLAAAQQSVVSELQPLVSEVGAQVSEQPAPVVPDERAAFNAWNNEDNLPIAGVGAKNAAWLAWQARAKLTGNSPVIPGAEKRIADAVELLKQAAPAMLADNGGPDGPLVGRLKSPVIPDGYVMVPKEPTQAMCAAFNDSDYGRKSLRERYVAMLAAAQQPQDEPQNIPEIIPGWIPVSERMPDDDDFVYIWPRPDFGVELHVGQYCECSPKGDGWYAQVYEQNYGIEWYPITVTHWMPLPADPQEVNHG